VIAEVLATFRQAVGVLKRQSGGTLSDEESAARLPDKAPSARVDRT